MSELLKLKEKCMAVTGGGTRCKNGGSQRHADEFHRYAICGQHANMLMEGKHIVFATHITAENIADSVTQATLPGINPEVAVAREALGNVTEIPVTIYYVMAHPDEGAVTALWKEELIVGQVFKSRLLMHATHNVTSEKVTGILIRTPEDKFGWVRNRNGWLKRDVSHIKTIKFNTNNKESK